jgi:hypothetical protein
MDSHDIIQKTYQTEMGMFGPPSVVSGTNAVIGNFTAFQVWEADTTIASITINGTPLTFASALTLPQGFIVYGVITSITLSAGTGLAYAGTNIS